MYGMKQLVLTGLASLVLAPFSYADCNPAEVKMVPPGGGQVRTFATVQAAVNAASAAGSLVEVGSGFYNEVVSVKKKNQLTIRSSCGATVTGFDVDDSSGLSLDYLRIVPAATGLAREAIVIRNKATNSSVLIAHSEIKGGRSGQAAVRVRQASSVLLYDNYIHDNSGIAVLLEENGGPVVLDSNTIERSATAVFMDRKAIVLLKANRIRQNTKGVEAAAHADPAEITLKNNFLTLNTNDVVNASRILDATDSGNVTTAGSEGQGVGLNVPPLAKVGEDQTFSGVGAQVQLDGTASVDREGDRLSYTWSFLTKPSQSTTSIVDPNEPRANFEADKLGDYQVQLLVFDGTSQSLADIVTITSGTKAPVANAGTSRTVPKGSTVSLNGSGSSPNPGTLSYAWRFLSVPANSTATIQNAFGQTPSFVADKDGDFEIELIVSNGSKASKPAIVTISTTNTAPIANAGTDANAAVGITKTLDGTQSSDPDSQALTYDWSLLYRPANSSAALNSTLPNPGFTADVAGTYVAQLLVSDGTKVAKDTIVITAAPNGAPIANAGPDKTVNVGQATVLDGTGSTDPEHDPISYSWQITGRPDDSTAQLANATTTYPTLTPDKAGSYTISLVVNDGFRNSAPDTVTVLANPLTQPPTANAGIDQVKDLYAVVTLDGSASTDPQNSPLSYAWTFASKPANSNATIANANTVSPSFVADAPGTYVARLVVTSVGGPSSPDTVSVSVVQPVNHAPTLNAIPNQTVSLGTSMSFTLTASDPDVGDKLSFSSLPLPAGATINSETGVFTFHPMSATPPSHTLTFFVTDEAGANNSKTMLVSVTSPPLSTPTSLSGRVLDTNSWAIDHIEVPIVGVTVKILGTDATATTNQNGYFTIDNIPDGYSTLDFNTSSAAPGPGGTGYGGFRENLASLIPHANNIIERPFYLPRRDESSVTPVTPTEPTEVVNPNLDIKLEVPANTAKNQDGTPFTGSISISEVPLSVAPVSLPPFIKPITLITIQPVGLQFSEPAPITFPNTLGFAPGSIMDINSVDPNLGIFVKVGVGRVSPDGTKIETIDGGINAADWHFVSVPNPTVANEEFNGSESPGKAFRNCGVACDVIPHSGTVVVTHDTVPYRSLGKMRSLRLTYNSKGAFPTSNVGLGITNIPDSPVRAGLGIQISVAGVTTPNLITATQSNAPQRQTVFFDSNQLESGVYRYSGALTTYFLNRTSKKVLKSVDGKGKRDILPIDTSVSFGQGLDGFIAVYNAKQSPFGTGWGLEEYFQIKESTEGASLIQGDGSVSFFARTGNSFTASLGEFSTLAKNGDGTYTRTMKDQTRYHFNAAGLLVKRIDRNGNVMEYCYSGNRLTHINDETGRRTTFQYTGDLITSITDPAGRVTRLFYDADRNLTSIEDPDTSQRNFSYDRRHLMITDMNKNGHVSSHAYNATGQVTYITRADGTSMSFEARQAKGMIDLTTGIGTADNPAPQVDAAEARITRIMDARGHVTEILSDAFGAPVQTKDPLNRVTTITRDTHSNPTNVLDANGSQFAFTYAQNGNMLTARNVDLNINFGLTYDPVFNQLTKITYPDNTDLDALLDSKGNVRRLTDQQNNQYTFTHNKAGQVLTRTDPLGNIATMEYDRATGNLIKYTDEEDRTSTFTYDPAGNVTHVRDPKGNVTQYFYDDNGRVTEVKDARSASTKFFYDDEGNLESVKDANNNVTAFTFDQRNRPLTKTDPKGKVERYSYDPVGNLIELRNRKNEVIGFEYDAANQLVKQILPTGDRNIAYDLTGHVTQVTDPSSAVTFTYDKNYRLKTESTAGSPNQPSVTVNYAYDGMGNLTEINDGVSPATTYQRDSLFRVSNVLSGPWNYTFGYDALSRRTTKAVNVAGSNTTYAFDLASQVKAIEHTKAGGTQVSSFQYKYDQNGNPSSRVETITGAPLAGSLSFGYDAVDQLTSATNPLPSLPAETFQYDLLGNRIRQQGDTEDHQIGLSNQILQDKNFIYTYDDNGNRIREVNRATGGVTNYVFDAENRLVQLSKHPSIGAPATSTVGYKYDGLGRRIRKTVDGDVTTYVYAQGDIRLEYAGSGALQANYVHGPMIDEPLILSRGGIDYFYSTDALGNVRSLMNQSGVTVESYAYDSFGNRTVFNSQGQEIAPGQGIKSPYGFTGREEDIENPGQKYYRARYYSSVTGTFLSEDPIGFDAGDENLHRYVGNMPTSYIDPSGEILLVPILIGAAGGALFEVGSQLLFEGRSVHCLDYGAIGTAAFMGGALGGVGQAIVRTKTVGQALQKVIARSSRFGKQGSWNQGVIRFGLGKIEKGVARKIWYGENSSRNAIRFGFGGKHNSIPILDLGPRLPGL